MSRVCILGAGIMGGAVASTLRRANCEVHLFNRTRVRAERLAECGIRICTTPKEAAEGCDVIISFVRDDKAAAAVWFGNEGATMSAAADAICMECSTLSVDHTDHWLTTLSRLRLRGIDCPVTGSKAAALHGTLTLFMGGQASAFEDARPVLEAISTQRYWLEKPGFAMRFKLVYNMLGGIILVALAEALSLGTFYGLDPNRIVEILSSNTNGWSAAAAKSKGPAMVSGRHEEVACALQTIAKDLQYAISGAKQVRGNIGVANAALRVLDHAVGAGLGHLDMSAVADYITRRESTL